MLHLELDVPDFAIAWASDVLRAYPHRAAIVTTHSYLNGVSGVRGYNRAVSTHGNSGEEVWNKLVRCHPQIFLVLCGHHLQTVAYHQVSTNDAGGRVVEMLADYQKLHHGGDAGCACYASSRPKGRSKSAPILPHSRHSRLIRRTNLWPPWTSPRAVTRSSSQAQTQGTPALVDPLPRLPRLRDLKPSGS